MNAESCIKIIARGSSGNSYTVAFYLEETGISAFCSCPAGEYRMLCKHVMHLIDGDASILYDSSQRGLLEQVCSHLKKTGIPLLLSELNESERHLKNARENVKRAKKALEKEILEK